ncbi:MAG: two-CW domain-containing protein [Candidatus Glassbacteria bacterium]
MQRRLNCWEFKKCGREPGGENVAELGVCPASIDSSCDGLNGGKNGGRICWSIAGTLCEGITEGTFARKFETCMECDFFMKVMGEENHKSFRWFK